ncbi:MAG: dodecin family protein [Bacteroidota bacterium]
MGVVKVIEILSNSDKSWEDAVKKAIKQAGKSVKNIRSANVQNHSVTINGDDIVEYRVNLKVAFEIDD